jgi:hypothetical protein
MDIVVISSALVKNEKQKKRVTRVPAKPAKKSRFVEKRRNRTDRRQSVRDGVVVRLSHHKDRRTRPDRRHTPTD